MSHRSVNRAMPCPMCRDDLRGNIFAGLHLLIILIARLILLMMQTGEHAP